MNWESALSASSSFAYYIFVLNFWHFVGLKGFCIGTIIGIFVKLVIMISVYYRTMKKHSATEATLGEDEPAGV